MKIKKIKRSASAVIVYGHNILLHPKGKRFQIIGGKSIDRESSMDTALRETTEEAGLHLDPKRLELIHEHKEGRVRHTFFLYRLIEAEVVSNFTPITSTKQPQWLPMVYLRSQIFYWHGYWTAIRIARKRLYTNLLSFVPAV